MSGHFLFPRICVLVWVYEVCSVCTQAISAIRYFHSWPSAAEALPLNTKLLKHGRGLQNFKLTYTIDLAVIIIFFPAFASWYFPTWLQHGLEILSKTATNALKNHEPKKQPLFVKRGFSFLASWHSLRWLPYGLQGLQKTVHKGP